jgi:hypothetical protein
MQSQGGKQVQDPYSEAELSKLNQAVGRYGRDWVTGPGSRDTPQDQGPVQATR